ncbi:MAG: thioredoxin family protein [Deltaproteobacteria bacterium]|nr:thioredoxin family protein [Deltaproteobacteria bacterium]
MSGSSPFDKRSDFFRQFFELARPYKEYVATGTPQQQERWAASEERASLTEGQRLLLAAFTRKLNVLVLSGTWCGDCIRQCPLIWEIEKASSVIECRYIDNQQHPELRDELRIAGGARVPVAVFLSEDFFEIARFGDRTLSEYKRKAATELGPACDIGTSTSKPEDTAEELREWLEQFHRAQLVLRLSPFLRARHRD